MKPMARVFWRAFKGLGLRSWIGDSIPHGTEPSTGHQNELKSEMIEHTLLKHILFNIVKPNGKL